MISFEAATLDIAKLEKKARADLHLIVDDFVHAFKPQERTKASLSLAG